MKRKESPSKSLQTRRLKQLNSPDTVPQTAHRKQKHNSHSPAAEDVKVSNENLNFNNHLKDHHKLKFARRSTRAVMFALGFGRSGGGEGSFTHVRSGLKMPL